MDCPGDLADEVMALEAYAEAQPQPWRVPWTPNPKQREFLSLHCREVLYGGSVRGGKSGALLLAALQYVHVPGYAAIIFRRTYPELLGADGLIEQSHRLLDGTGARWVKSELTWVFPSTATLRFGHIQHEDDKLQYHGQAFQFIGFDELTHFTESMYTYLFSRCVPPAAGARPELARVPLRVRGTTNPGGPGHKWVKARFAIRDDGSQDAERAVNHETGEPRPFIRATLQDNAANVNVEEYRRGLTNLDAATRANLEFGRWVQDGHGLVYSGFNRKRSLVSFFDVSRGPWFFILAVDLGSSMAKKTTAFVLLAYHGERNEVVVVQSEKRAAMIPSTIAARIQEFQDAWPLEQVVVDQGGLGGGYIGEFQTRFGELITGVEKKNKLGYRHLMNGAFEKAELLVVGAESQSGDVEGPNTDLAAELETLPWAEGGLDCEKGADDHLSDALLYGWRSCLGFAAEAPAKRPEPGSAEWARAEEARMEAAASEAVRWETETPWYEGGVD